MYSLFISSDNTLGFWSPMTATLDWCEGNYEITHYVVEFWNAVSSLFISFVGLLLLYQSFKYKYEQAFHVWGIIGFTIGLGSALFHGTLLYEWQMADEVPMMWMLGVWLYVMAGLKKPRNQANTLLAVFTTLYMGAVSLIHIYSAFILVFQLHFGILVIVGVVYSVVLSIKEPDADSDSMRKIWLGALFTAAACWLTDKFLCDHIRTVFPVYPELHAFWHLFIGLHSYITVCWTTARRLNNIGRGSVITWHFIIFPVVTPRDAAPVKRD